MSTALTADELNHVVYRYLLESEFGHTAWIFAIEAGINNPTIATNSIPRGALIETVVMGLQFKEMRANASEGDDEDNFCFLPPMDLIKKDIDALQEIVRREIMKKIIARSMDQGRGSEGGSKDPIKGNLKTWSSKSARTKNVAEPKDPGKGNEGSRSSVITRGKTENQNKVRKAPVEDKGARKRTRKRV